MTPAPYVSIDLETSGLEPAESQILEFAAIIEDWVSPVETLPRFHCYVENGLIFGTPGSLAMNPVPLARLGNPERTREGGYLILDRKDVAPAFVAFLEANGFDPHKRAFTPAGKNFSGFDRQFLKRLPGFQKIKMAHRVIDPAMLWWDPRVDAGPPNSETCRKRAGLSGPVAHTAVADAIAVIQMVRAVFSNI